MSARSLLLGLLIGATGVGGLAVTGTSPLGISFTTAAQKETTDAANQFGTGNAAAPNRQAPSGNTGVGAPAESSPSSAPTTSSTATPSSSSSSAAPTTTTAPPEAPKPPAQPSQPGNKTPEQAVLELVNDQRAAKGCKALVIDDRITTAAQGHSTDMANKGYFAHESPPPEKSTFVQRMKDAGYPKPGGENIAMGYATPAAVMDGWMKSQGHRDNILNCSFTTMGVGLDTRGNYWTQNFGY